MCFNLVAEKCIKSTYILECAYEWLRMSIGSTTKVACVCVLSLCEYALRNTPCTKLVQSRKVILLFIYRNALGAKFLENRDKPILVWKWR